MDTDYIHRYAHEHLTDKRRRHTAGVRKTAFELCELYGGDYEKADIAATCHDLFRGKRVDEINYYVNKYGLDRRYLGNASLAHGKIAARFMQEELGITDPEILDAVSFHTTGRAGMTLLDKIIYLADAIEPGRDYQGLETLRTEARKDLDKACLLSLLRSMDFVRAKGEALDIDTIKAKEDLERKINGK